MSGSRLICVVDDDEAVRAAIANLLRAESFRTQAFDSAEALLSSGDHRTASCVIADIQMPGMSGIGLANRLGQMNPPIPVILMTARTEPEVLESAAGSRAAFLLQKPFSSDRLLECVRSVLR